MQFRYHSTYLAVIAAVDEVVVDEMNDCDDVSVAMSGWWSKAAEKRAGLDDMRVITAFTLLDPPRESCTNESVANQGI